MKVGRYSFVIYFDGEGGGAGTGAPAGAPAAPSGGTPASTTASPGSSGTPGAASSTGTPAGNTPVGTDRPSSGAPAGDPDPNRFIPRQRYNEVATRLREAEAMSARYKGMLEAGTGVKVPGIERPQDPAITEARNLLLDQIMPELKPLLKLTPEQLEKVIKAADEFPTFQQRYQSSEEAHWAGRGEQALEYIATNMAKDLGVDKLTPFQQLTVGNTFIAWLRMDQDRLAKYGRGDTQVYESFLTEYRSGFFDPLRRVGQAGNGGTAARNATLPPAVRRSGAVATQTGAPKPQTEDEIHDNAWKNFAAAQAGSR